jgi:hypothetical protein
MFKIFRMSKTATIGCAVVCLVTAFACNVIHLPLFIPIFVTWGLVFGCIYAYKFIRDRSIMSASRLPAHYGPILKAPPAMSSEGSTRLFVPQPLERR